MECIVSPDVFQQLVRKFELVIIGPQTRFVLVAVGIYFGEGSSFHGHIFMSRKPLMVLFLAKWFFFCSLWMKSPVLLFSLSVFVTKQDSKTGSPSVVPQLQAFHFLAYFMVGTSEYQTKLQGISVKLHRSLVIFSRHHVHLQNINLPRTFNFVRKNSFSLEI